MFQLHPDGCRDPPVLSRGTLLDGHNRYEICTEHRIKFTTVERKCKDREDAKAFIARAQLGRRNIPDYVRFEIGKYLLPVIKAQAVESHAQTRGKSLTTLGKDPVHTHVELGKTTGLSSQKIVKALAIDKRADEPTKAALRAGTTTINREYTKLKSLAAE